MLSRHPLEKGDPVSQVFSITKHKDLSNLCALKSIFFCVFLYTQLTLCVVWQCCFILLKGLSVKKSVIIFNIVCLVVVDFCYSKKNEHKSNKTEIVAPALTSDVATRRPKILVFSSKGGNGHMAACATLNDVLPNCDIKLVYPIEDFFKKTGVIY